MFISVASGKTCIALSLAALGLYGTSVSQATVSESIKYTWTKSGGFLINAFITTGSKTTQYQTSGGGMQYDIESSTNPGESSGFTFQSYCIEIPEDVSRSYEAYTINTAESLIGDADAQAIGKLWAQYDAGNLEGEHATAFQIAVWNIIYDDDYYVGLGKASFSCWLNSVVIEAQGMLDWLKTYGSSAPVTQMTILSNDGYQDQIVIADYLEAYASVPEPATLGIAALGAVTLLTHRRKSL